MASKFYKTGVVLTNTFSIGAPLQDMQTKVLDDNSVWALIFEQNSKNGTVLFSSINEVMNTQTADKYSRFNLLDNNSFKAITDGKYEFMLCYPDNTDKYNRWRQTNNPCNEYKGNDDVSLTADGYEAVSIAWTSNYWGGLTRQNEDKTTINRTFISGSVGSSAWYYAIGTFIAWNDGMPACTDLTGGNTIGITGRVQLWVRIDNTNATDGFKIYDKCIIANDFIEI